MSARSFTLPAVACAVLGCALNSSAQPQPVRLSTTAMDPTFGTGGKRVFDLFGGFDVTFSLAVQPDLKVLVGGWSDTGGSRYGTITRLNSDASTDLGFAGRGVLANGEIDSFTALKALPDGSIIAAGTIGRAVDWGMGVMRLDRNGQIDSKFGDGSGNGYTYLDLRPGLDEPLAIAAQADGKILVAGMAGSTGDNRNDFGLVRLNANGRPDTTFGGARTGKVTTDFQTRPMGGDIARALTLRPDGRIIAGGSAYNIDDEGRADKTFAIAQYDSTGRLDPSFGNGGRVTTAFGAPISRTEIQDLTLQPDGKLVAVGFGGDNGQLLLARYTTTGQLDPSFGQGGTARLQIGGGWKDFNTRLLPDGKIFVATAGELFLLALYSADGQLVNAVTTAPYARNAYSEIGGSEITPDGKIVWAGRIIPAPDAPPGSGWNANDVTVARSIEAQSLVPDPTATPLILGGLAVLARRRRGKTQ